MDYTTDLKDLKQNALIRLERPKVCTGTEFDYEVCFVVPIVNRHATINQFILPAWDTYYLSRQIPVPAPVTPTPTVTQIATTVGNVQTFTTPVPIPTVLQLRNFSFRFEHDSPSNIWGKGCHNIGRVNTKNPYEAELFHPNQICLSGGLSINGQLNYLQTYDEIGKTDIELKDNSGIIGVYVETGMICLITQLDHARVGYNDNLARLDSKGNLVVGSADNAFGKPERKTGDKYGCNIADKLSIRERNGLIMWVDRNRAEAVQYNWNQIQTLTKDKCDGWFKAKVKQVLSDENQYFEGSISPATNEYLVSNNSVEDTVYINQERTYNALVPETVSFDIKTRDLIQWFGFVGENYAYLDGDILNVQMFSFKEGLPYSHYNGKENKSFNKFFGVQTEKVLRPVYNTDAFAKKMVLVITNYCEQQLFFADKIFTEARQESRILLAYWDKAAYMSFGTFLCDLNTIPDPNLPDETGPNKLTDGDRLIGCWVDVRLIGDPAHAEDYCEILGVEVLAFKYEKS